MQKVDKSIGLHIEFSAPGVKIVRAWFQGVESAKAQHATSLNTMKYYFSKTGIS